MYKYIIYIYIYVVQYDFQGLDPGPGLGQGRWRQWPGALRLPRHAEVRAQGVALGAQQGGAGA